MIASWTAELAGLSSLSYGAYSLVHWLGFMVAGLSLVLIGESLVPSTKAKKTGKQ